MTRNAKAQQFFAAHKAGDPLVLYNIWDAGSARTVAAAGAMAVATGSDCVAAAQGFRDGENLPLDTALEIVGRIVGAVGCPVSFDIESGYGEEPGLVAANVVKAMEIGVVGINLEDTRPASGAFFSVDEQSARLVAVREAADRSGGGLFINARCDVFLKAAEADHDAAFVEAVARSQAYLAAGADGIFLPGLQDLRLLTAVCEAVGAPINAMAAPGGPTRQALAASGVARISHGPFGYRALMDVLAEQAKAALAPL